MTGRRLGALVLAAMTLTFAITETPARSATHIAAFASATTTVTLKVDAASSLTAAFTALAAKYHKKHSNVSLAFTFDSSATLAAQINAGDGADIFASASPTNMKTVIDAGGISKARTFASNRIVIATRKSQGRLRSARTLRATGLAWVRCVDSAPCGAAAIRALNCAGVSRGATTTYNNDATQVTHLLSGDASAALIYRSDVVANRRLLALREFPLHCRNAATTRYPIGVTTTSAHSVAARKFVAYVLSRQGQAILRKYGFRGPRA